MTATLLDLKSAIKRELRNRTDIDTQIAASINSAIYHYQKDKFWFTEETSTKTTTASTATVALPTDFGFLDGITILFSTGTLPVRLTKRDLTTLLDMGGNSTTYTGLPTDYAIYADALYLYPVPNGVYTLTLYQNFLNAPPTLDADTSDWTNPAKAEELIRSRAVADIECHILKKAESKLEMAQVAPLGFFSMREKIAHDRLNKMTNQRISSGIRAVQF